MSQLSGSELNLDRVGKGADTGMADHNNSPDLGDELDTAATTSEQWGFGGLQTHGAISAPWPAID